MNIKFWGTRGSIPVPGESTIRYGGNTPCVEIRTKDDSLIILDAGSGIRELGNQLISNKDLSEINIFLTHYHWDHIQGIPFFTPIYKPDYKINFYGIRDNGRSVEELLKRQMEHAYFPIKLDEINKNLSYCEITSNSTYEIKGLTIETFLTNHPSKTVTLKITEGDRSFVYMTDNEINLEGKDDMQTNDELRNHNLSLINFCAGADYLLHDAMYDEEEVFRKKGWGHSSNKSLARFAALAGIKNLILFHYSPEYNDEKIDQIISETQMVLDTLEVGIKCIGSKEGLEIII
jgi:phosphoribosyl 1,2-cyclic phosphodiesterase